MNPIRKSIEIYDAKISFMSLVDRPANRRPFLLTKSEDDPNVYQIVGSGRILDVYSYEKTCVGKASKATSHYVTGIAYEPMVADTDDNFMTAEEIEKMAHWYLKNGRMVDEQHDFEQNFNCHIVESWIAPDDTAIGDQTVKKGTWLVKVEVNDDDIWKKINAGEITGFSVGGLAKYGTEEVDLDNQSTEGGDSSMEVERSEKQAGNAAERRSLLAKVAKFLGFDAESDAISKGSVADKFAERLKCEGFWIAFSTLQDELKYWDWRSDKPVFEGDPQKVADALSDFNKIVTALLTGSPDQIISAIAVDAEAADQPAAPVKKAGKKLSTARLNRLKAVQAEVNSLVSELSDAEEEGEEKDPTNDAAAESASVAKSESDEENRQIAKEETQMMTQDEITSISDAVIKGIMDALPTTAAVEMAAPAPAATGVTAEQVKEMIAKAVADMNKDTPPAEVQKTEVQPDALTIEKVAEMIKTAVDQVKQARGAARSLNDDGGTVEKAEKPDLWAGLL